MSVEKITKEMFRCHCEAKHKDGAACNYSWDADHVPLRCPRCKSRRWNRAARLSAKAPITFNGETLTVAEWSRRLGLAKTTIPWRMKEGWPLEQVMTSEDWRKQS